MWDYIPEIAANLGETQFMTGERSSRVRGMTADVLRERTCDQLYHQPLLVAFAGKVFRGVNVYNLLTNNPSSGNPVVFALDRFAPADILEPDWAARRICDFYASRGLDDVYAWQPDLLLAPEDTQTSAMALGR
jgi:hypothetical protein